MERLKSIDIVRGLALVWMIYGHLSGFWLTEADHWEIVFVRQFGDWMGSGAFLLIAGVSTMLSYRNRIEKAAIDTFYSKKQVRNEYMLRAFFLFLIAIGYNSVVAIQIMNPTRIWSWFILMTISFCLVISWPFLRTSKWVRLILAGAFCILNQVIFRSLLPYQGQADFFGVLFHILYNSPDLDPVLAFIMFFLVGTVIGDIIYDVFKIENQEERRLELKKKLLYPNLIGGGILITIGVIIEFPLFLQHRTFPWLLFSLGMVMVFFTILLSIEIYEKIKTQKSFRFLYYFSYYSFTIYLSHYVLFIVFYHQLNWFWVWFFIAPTIIILGLILRALYNSRWRQDVSIKIQIGRLSTRIAKRIEEKKKNTIE